MMLQDLTRFLQVAGIGTETTNLFYGSMPSTPDDAVCLYEYAGRPPDFAHTGMDFQNPGLQIVARSRSYATARTKIEEVFNLLKNIANFDLYGTKYLRIAPQQSPFPLGIDENNRYRLAVNFAVSIAA